MMGPMDFTGLWLGLLIGWLAHRRLRQMSPPHGLVVLLVTAAAGWLMLPPLAGSPSVEAYGARTCGWLPCLSRFRAVQTSG